MEVNWDRV